MERVELKCTEDSLTLIAREALKRNAGARGLRGMLQRSDNGVMLEELGFAADVLACSELDTVPVVPLLDGNVLRLRTNEEKKEPAR